MGTTTVRTVFRSEPMRVVGMSVEPACVRFQGEAGEGGQGRPEVAIWRIPELLGASYSPRSTYRIRIEEVSDGEAE